MNAAAWPAVTPAAHGARRRWPLLAIGASAGTAVWSGWVGLGELTGFGVVRPLPGIADSFAINTAVTLPIGVEAYAMYALSIATSSRTLPDRTRRYAWASSAAALLLGMAGQVAYHLMTAHQPTEQPVGQMAGSAPWWVIALVSCLPVLVLGAASLLWHLAGQTENPEPDLAAQSGSEYVTESENEPSTEHEPGTEHAPQTEYRLGQRYGNAAEHGRSSGPSAQSGPGSRSRRVSTRRRPNSQTARTDDVARVRAAIAAGDLPPVPTVQAIRDLLGIGSAYASATRDAIAHDPSISDVDTSALPIAPTGTVTDPTSMNGHAFTARSTHSEESTETTDSQPDHKTEALFTGHPAQPFSNSNHDLKPVST